MKNSALKVGRFGVLTALSLVLGYFDRAIPITMLLSGAVPGIKLGLANTVLLYGVYLMNWQSCAMLMLAKVLLSGFLYGSMSAILYSLAGGALSDPNRKPDRHTFASIRSTQLRQSSRCTPYSSTVLARPSLIPGTAPLRIIVNGIARSK